MGDAVVTEDLLEDVRLDLEHAVGGRVTDHLVLPSRHVEGRLSVLFELGVGAGRRVFEVAVRTDSVLPIASGRPAYVGVLPDAVAPLADLRRAYAALDRCAESPLVDLADLESVGGAVGIGLSVLGSGWWTNPVVTSLTTGFLEDLLAGSPLEWALRRADAAAVTS